MEYIEVRAGTRRYEAAQSVEERVFRSNGFPYDYPEYAGQSRLFGAYESSGCYGALRLISSQPLPSPFFRGCALFDADRWIRMGNSFEEVGTVAVPRQYEKLGHGLHLYRAAYISARKRDVTHWGIVMEAERVAFFNEVLNYAFEPAGTLGWKEPDSERVWDDVGPFVTSIEDCERKIAQNDPNVYKWLIEPLPAALRRFTNPPL